MARQQLRLRDGVQLSVQVMVFSTVGVAGALLVFWVPARFALVEFLTDMDMSALEAAVDPVVRRRSFVEPMNSLARLYFTDLSVLTPRIYHPVAALMFFRLSSKRFAAVVLALVVLVVAASLYVRYVKFLTDVGSLLPSFFGTVLISLVLPRGNSYLSLGLLQTVGLAATLTIHVVMSSMPPTTDHNKMLLSCTFFPALREAIFGLSRYSARKLMLYRQPGGAETVRRHFVWVFVLWAQLGMSMLVRMFFSGFRSTSYLTLTVVVQSVIEIVSRLSIDWRDSKLRSAIEFVKRTCCSGTPSSRVSSVHETNRVASSELGSSKRDVLVVPMTLVPVEAWTSVMETAAQGSAKHLAQAIESARGNTLRAMATLPEFATELEATSALHHKIAHSSFTSVVVLGEMLSEYTAILLIPLLLIMFENQRLAMPFDYYAHVPEPFRDAPIDRWDLALATGIQLVSELGVDSLCCFVETRRGHNLPGIWRQAQWLGPQLVWATMLASSGTSFFMQHETEVSRCTLKNYCTCKGARLVAGGLREMYW